MLHQLSQTVIYKFNKWLNVKQTINTPTKSENEAILTYFVTQIRSTVNYNRTLNLKKHNMHITHRRLPQTYTTTLCTSLLQLWRITYPIGWGLCRHLQFRSGSNYIRGHQLFCGWKITKIRYYVITTNNVWCMLLTQSVWSNVTVYSVWLWSVVGFSSVS